MYRYVSEDDVSGGFSQSPNRCELCTSVPDMSGGEKNHPLTYLIYEEVLDYTFQGMNEESDECLRLTEDAVHDMSDKTHILGTLLLQD